MSAEAQGSLPDGWTRVRFGDIVRNKNLPTKDPQEDGLNRIVGLTHLDSGSLPIVRWDILDGETSFSRTFAAGDVLFGKRRAYQRKVGVPDFAGICSGDILVFESKNSSLLQEFLPYIVQSDAFFERAVGTSAGSLSPRTNWTQLARFEFALPPLEEQKRIVEIQGAFGDALSALHGVSAKAAGLLDVFLQERFREAGYDWKPSTLGEVAKLTIGRTPPRNESHYWTDSLEYPFCTIADMTSTSVSPQREGVTAAAIADGKAKRVPAGSLIMSFKLTIGRLGIAARDIFPNEAIVWIEPREGVTRDFLHLWMGQQDLESLVGRAVKGKTLNGPSLRSIPVSVPPTAVQQELVRTAECVRRLQRDAERETVALQGIRTAVREIEMGQQNVQ